MLNKDWEKIKHFNKSEYAYPNRMKFKHVKKIDQLRENINTSIIDLEDFNIFKNSFNSLLESNRILGNLNKKYIAKVSCGESHCLFF